MVRIDHAGLLVAALVMTGGTGRAAGHELQGIWSGPGAILTATPDGAQLQQDCAEGRFGPVALDSAGSFRATGAWEDHAPGPQAGDAAPARKNAVFEGRVQGDTLVLTVSRGDRPAQSFTLLKGKRAKLIRCL